MPQFLTERLSGPLGMAGTGFEVPARKPGRFTSYHRTIPPGGLELVAGRSWKARAGYRLGRPRSHRHLERAGTLRLGWRHRNGSAHHHVHRHGHHPVRPAENGRTDPDRPDVRLAVRGTPEATWRARRRSPAVCGAPVGADDPPSHLVHHVYDRDAAADTHNPLARVGYGGTARLRGCGQPPAGWRHVKTHEIVGQPGDRV